MADSPLLSSLTSPLHQTSLEYEPNRDVKTLIANTVSGTAVSRYTYQYDAMGRRNRRQQEGTALAAANVRPSGSWDDFGYNLRSEVISSSNTGNSTLVESYQYDPIGNRQSAATSLASWLYSETNLLNQYTELSRTDITQPVILPEYDADGNLTAFGDWAYTWNGEFAVFSANGRPKVARRVRTSGCPGAASRIKIE